MHIVVADRYQLLRAGVAGILRQARPLEALHEAGSMAALTACLERHAADLLLLDLGLPGCDGIAAIQHVRASYPHIMIVALADDEDPAAILACLGAGALGYLPRAAEPGQLLQAVETVIAGAVFAPASLAGPRVTTAWQAASPTVPRGFTGRQGEVLHLLMQGCSTKAIARQLDLAVGTVKVHLAAIYRQLGVHSRLEALAWVHGAQGAVAAGAMG